MGPDLSVSVDCRKCAVCCCGFMPHYRPVLMPWEKPEQLFGLVDKYKKLYVLRKRSNGRCVFLDKDNRCSIHQRRPFECKIYPFRLMFHNYVVRMEIDNKCLQHGLFSTLSAARLLNGLSGYKFPAAWVWSYLDYQKQKNSRVAER